LRLYKERDDKMASGPELVEFDDEVADFHKYFENNVKMILGLEDSPKIVGHHVPVEGKEIDFLVVDGLDRVYFVEIKRGENQENRREVINQIIDYWSRCQSYVSELELPKKAKEAIKRGYVNPVIVTDELVDDHRYLLPLIKLGENNIRIRLIEIRRWKSGDEAFVTTSSVNTQEPVGLPTRERKTREELLLAIKDPELKVFARKLDKLFTEHDFRVKQHSKSRLAYTIGRYNRLFVLVCANPVSPDKVGDFVVTKEHLNIGVAEDIWKDCPIEKAGRHDPWEGEVYCLPTTTEEEKDDFLAFLDRVLAATKKHLGVQGA
jgi:hypothetical protein